MSNIFQLFRQTPFSLLFKAVIVIGVSFLASYAQDELKNNAYGLKKYTFESEHFRLSYTAGLERVAKEAGDQFEKLYSIYKGTYDLSLPSKTEVLVIDGELTNGFAFANLNFIVIWCHDLDWNLRGTHDWLKGVCTHEFGHIVSLWSSMKLPSWAPYIQLGYFTFPNDPNRVDALHVFPSITVPPWLAEGIAQYEDSRHGTDSWDTHRDMIMRTLSLSNTLLSWEHMSVMTGRGDDFEKTYNHGFSLVQYIANHYGYEKIVSLLRENSLIYRLGFDGSVKAVLGISARKLYKDWNDSLSKHYADQIKKIGPQVYGRKINKEGYDNFWPKFSPNGKKIYFLSNGEEDYSFSQKILYSYNLVDTVKEDDKIKPEKGINGFYSIHAPSGLIAYTSMKSPKSVAAPAEGGDHAFDVFIDTLPPEKRKFSLFKKKTERQITEKKRAFTAVFSPTGNVLACARRIRDHFYLAVVDTNGKNFRIMYPDSSQSQFPIAYIYSLDWSSDGRHIAISYIDSKNRKIGIFDTLTKEFSVVANSNHDDRDPRYAANGKNLYFSSDKTGIFNIYRYNGDQRTIQQLTNVSGGAFTPDVSIDEKKLVFSSYDTSGYSIYLIDTVKAVAEAPVDSLLVKRDTVSPLSITTPFSPLRSYSHIPRQLLFIPTFITEEVLARGANTYKGRSTFLSGGILGAMDPFAAMNQGSEISAYLLFEPTRFFQLIDFGKGLFNPTVNYDLGLMATTRLLPTTLSLNVFQRGLSDQSNFFDETEGQSSILTYGITLRNLDIIASRPITDALKLHLLTSYNSYDVYLDNFSFRYAVANGARAGLLTTLLAPEHDSRSLISPRGLYAKIRYNFWSQNLIDDDQSFKTDETTGLPIANLDNYNYHEAGLSIKMGSPSPWYDKHDLYLECNGSALMTTDQVRNWLHGKGLSSGKSIPSFYQNVEWVPGYTYYYPYYFHYLRLKTKPDSTTEVVSDSAQRDTVLITGNAVAMITGSYRFPLTPHPLDTRVWFLYLDKLYGAINFTAAAGWRNVSDVRHFGKEDWLSSVGAELRLEALSFSDFPMAIKLRWDRGLNRSAPIGGDRFTLGIGFSFDNWEYIDEPDYGSKRFTRPANR